MKTKDISDAKADIEQLNAAISKADADAMQAGKEIAGLNKDMAVWADDKKAAEAIREERRATFKDAQEDYQKTLDADVPHRAEFDETDTEDKESHEGHHVFPSKER